MTNKDLDGIPERIKKLEETLGLNKTEISEKTGINRSFYYKGSKGEQSISFDFLCRLCATFNVSADWLIFGSGQMFRDKNEFLTKLDQSTIELLEEIDRFSIKTKIAFMRLITTALETINEAQKKD